MEDLLHYDLIIQILSYLPPKDLIRLRTLSKLWFSTIADPKFIQLHRSHFCDLRCNGRIVIPRYNAYADIHELHLFSESNAILNTMELIDNSNTKGIWMVAGTCNGLISLFRHASYYYDTNHSHIMVCNPSIRRSIRLPDCHFTPQKFILVKYGIGFDSVEGDYKILMLGEIPSIRAPSWNPFCAVYSLKSKLWKKVETLVPSRHILGVSIFLHGSIHWIMLPSTGHKRCILLYDVRNEVFKQMPFPEFVNYGGRHLIFVVRGWLCAMKWNMEENRYTCCEVWMTKDYGVVESWTMQFRCMNPFEVQGFVGLTIGGKILGKYHGVVAKDGKLSCHDESSDEAHLRFQITLFDPQTKEFTNVCHVRWYDRDAFSLEETIESLNFLGF